VALLAAPVLSVGAACSGTAATQHGAAAGSRVVQRDLQQIARTFPHWRVHTARLHGTDETRCADTRDGTFSAGIERTYTNGSAPSGRLLQVTVAVEYRPAVNSRRFVAAFARPDQLECERASERRYFHHGTHALVYRVRVTAGLPRSLAGLLGPRARGYRVAVRATLSRSSQARLYDLRFVYQDARNPHVVYHVFIYVGEAKPPVSLASTLARRVIRASR
jgi:hypothetical protein